MRFFNTSGPCDPERHYTVLREGLVAQGQVLVAQGSYFTLFAPRQAGKTTYFQLLFRQLATQGYLPVWISFESLKTLSRQKFYYAFNHELQRALRLQGVQVDYTITDQYDLQGFFELVHAQTDKLVLVIDEFEDLPNEVVSELLHAFRKIYQQKQFYALHSLMLVGVSTIAELVVSSASPFNIVNQLEIPYFTFGEVQEIIAQYVSEAGQTFEPDVVRAIYENTQGQPGLVSALCQYLVETAVTDRSQPVSMAAFYPTLKHFLTERQDKNILNIVRKAKEKPAFMMRLLFGQTPIPFTIDDPNIAFLAANGVIENVNGNVEIPVPLYSKRLITAFRPLINGEADEFTLAHDTLAEYVTDNVLNLHQLLDRYREYVQRRGFHAFDTAQLKEGAWHYSLDGFIHFFIQRLGGDTLAVAPRAERRTQPAVEVPSGRGRTDILILFKGHKYIIETKVFSDQGYFLQGKQQLADYLTSEGLDEGYYVVFSAKHQASDTLYSEEMINGKRIRTWIIRTDFKAPSRRKRKQQQKQ